MDRWRGRVALVTGASVGIGAAICKCLVAEGLKVVGAARNLGQMEELRDSLSSCSGSLIPIQCDLTKDDQIYALFDKIKKDLGGVDICINNAGIAYDATLIDGTPEQWRSMIDVNVIALCLCTKLTIHSMRERGVDDGHIIHISSTSAHRVAGGHIYNFYAGTKYAVRALAEGLRKELRELKSHIRITCVSPGIVKTEFAKRQTGDEKAKILHNSMEAIKAKDVAEVVKNALSAPPYVEINDVIMRPIEQDT